MSLPGLLWGGVFALYVVAGIIWAGMLQSEGPPRNAHPGTDRYELWQEQKYRNLKRLWIWIAGLLALLGGWWITVGPD